jgi:NAD(P)-dependent dehydrogenase (short-subunit alcohol dehydrogenase family)
MNLEKEVILMDKRKVVIVTGGGKGIGYGVSEAFAEANYNIVITGRTTDTLNKAKEELEKKYKVDVLAVIADGRNEDEVKKVVNLTIEKFGSIDVLINNAQASKSGKMLVEHTDEDFDLAIYSGLYGTFHYMRECYPYLKESKGSVINFASGAGLFGKPGQSSYAASKEGIRGLTRVAATEWGPDNINVNIVCPLVMTEQLKAWKEEYPDVYEATIKGIPMGRFGDAKTDIGGVCLFLASPAASYISGETITLQGGSGLRP